MSFKVPRRGKNTVHPPVSTPEVMAPVMEAALVVAGDSTDPLAPVVEMSRSPGAAPREPHQMVMTITDEHEVHALLLAGHTVYEVATHMTIKTGRRWTEADVDNASSQIAKQNISRTTEQKAHIFQRELDRIEFMIKVLWPQVTSGNHQAIDRVTRLQERKAALLGLDAPDVLASWSIGGKAGADLSKLTTEELKTYQQLLLKAGG